VLLLVPRTALLGALLYLPIIGNIAVLTWATRFGNTAYMAALMTLAALYLVAWDARRLAPLFRPPADRLRWPRRPARAGAAGLGVAGGLVTTLAMRGLVPGVAKAQLATVMLAGLALLALAAALALADHAWTRWRRDPDPASPERQREEAAPFA
jgi:small-conductance mechanosensitive channel